MDGILCRDLKKVFVIMRILSRVWKEVREFCGYFGKKNFLYSK